MDTTPLPHINRARQLLSYNPESGVLVWNAVNPGDVAGRKDRTDKTNAKTWNSRMAGKTAGCPCDDGRLRVTVDGSPFYGHRLAWLIFYGEEPSGFIDHINGHPSDNRICNLRIVDSATNSRNKISLMKSNTGIRGVYKRGERYRVIVRNKGKTITIGTFPNVDDARNARLEYDRNNGFTDRHMNQ